MDEETEKLKSAVVKYLERWSLKGDNHFYSPKEWSARGEEIGVYADLTLTCEGEFNHTINGYMSDSRHLIDDFNRTVNNAGFWWEFGFAWSLHFYRMEGKK